MLMKKKKILRTFCEKSVIKDIIGYIILEIILPLVWFFLITPESNVNVNV